MLYSNGYDLDRVLPVLMGRKGWMQPTVSTFTPTISEENLKCVSSMYYNYDHSSCSPVNIWKTQEDGQISNDDFNTVLSELKKQVAIESLTAVFRQPCLIEPPKILFEKQFRTSYKPIPNSGKFCGWQLKISEGDYATKIDSVALTMSKECTVTIYLYNDLKADPIWSKELTVDTPNNQQIFNLEEVVMSRLNDTHKGGVFFLGYYQDEIEAQVTEGVDVYLNWWEQFNMVGYQGFEAASNYEAKTFVRDQYFSNYRTYGFNVEMSTFRDYTNTIVRNQYAFDKLQGLVMTVKCIELQMNTQRSNATERLSRENYEMLYNELEGIRGDGQSVPYRQGLRDKVMREVKQLQKTFFDDSEIITAIPPVVGYDSYNNPKWGHQI